MDVLLINMPFAPLLRPSLPLSVIKARLAEHNVSSRVLYFTIQFAEELGVDLYSVVANQLPRQTDLVGEFIFAQSLFHTLPDDYVSEIMLKPPQFDGDEKPASQDFIQRVLNARDLAEDFVDRCVLQVMEHRPKIVIFDCNIQQQTASLALAQRIHTQLSAPLILFTGKSCHGVMGAELVRQFPFVDAIVSGEIDLILHQIVDKVLAGSPLSDLQGVYTPHNIDRIFSEKRFASASMLRDMDSLPYPDYSDFFRQHKESSIANNSKKQLFFEMSRGCWWGEKSHCTFCGLNNESMTYRSKSPQRALNEIIYLSETYPESLLSSADTILDIKYFKNLIPDLASHKLQTNLFYEVKANLTKEQLTLLRHARIRKIQPGVESLSTSILELMRKGVSAIQNIQLLKWCKELGIRPFWNFLFGFPGEDVQEYDRMAKLVPLIAHLPAPQGFGRVRIERFSPSFNDPNRFGFTNVEPSPAYSKIYPLPAEALRNLAMYFTYGYQNPQDVAPYIQPLRDQVVVWRNCEASSDLFSINKKDSIILCDVRAGSSERVKVLKGLDRILYLACDSIQSDSELKALAHEHQGTNADVELFQNEMLKSGMMISEKNCYLSLAVPVGIYSPSNTIVNKLRSAA